MRLHGYFRSSTSYRLRIALNLKGLAYDYVPVSLIKGEQNDAAYVARDPFASVPLLEAAGRDRAQSMGAARMARRSPPRAVPCCRAMSRTASLRASSPMPLPTETHAVNNLQVLKYLKDPLGHAQDEVDEWYRHWLARTFEPVEARLAQYRRRTISCSKRPACSRSCCCRRFTTRTATRSISRLIPISPASSRHA